LNKKIDCGEKAENEKRVVIDLRLDLKQRKMEKKQFCCCLFCVCVYFVSIGG